MIMPKKVMLGFPGRTLRRDEEAWLSVALPEKVVVERLIVPSIFARSILITRIAVDGQEQLFGQLPARFFGEMDFASRLDLPSGQSLTVGVLNNHHPTLSGWRRALVWLHDKTGINLFGASKFCELNVQGIVAIAIVPTVVPDEFGLLGSDFIG